MKEASRISPFDGRNGQEIQEKWLLWKKHAALERETPQKQTDRRSEQTDRRLEEPLPMSRPVFQHQRYDAVMKRMQHAVRQTGDYTSVS